MWSESAAGLPALDLLSADHARTSHRRDERPERVPGLSGEIPFTESEYRRRPGQSQDFRQDDRKISMTGTSAAPAYPSAGIQPAVDHEVLHRRINRRSCVRVLARSPAECQGRPGAPCGPPSSHRPPLVPASATTVTESAESSTIKLTAVNQAAGHAEVIARFAGTALPLRSFSRHQATRREDGATIRDLDRDAVGRPGDRAWGFPDP